ncbi:hypothetical protein HLPCO_002656 [Haloplasma contractile SSD-17B]|uniref:DUF2975 domain-containing protein n=1 Tax=Haloplasma contractile SSD-17B TaxID=1033810 RepID=F7Q0X5_9MOLU|nr:hypothetical protein HLPCO_002656 [Haloplasma contractile SSD-17B]
MVEFLIFFIMSIVLLFITRIDLKKYGAKKQNVMTTRLLIVLSRFTQVLILIYVSVSMYQITYFIFNRATLPILNIMKINNDVQSVFDWGVPIVILFRIINNIVIFGILEFTIQILKDFLQEVSFTEEVVKRFIMIANLFIVKIFISIILTYSVTGTLSFNYEHLLVYGLMIVLIKYFLHGKKIQEDSDLSI